MNTQLNQVHVRWHDTKTGSHSYLGWKNRSTYLFSLDVFNDELNAAYWTLRASQLMMKHTTEAGMETLANELRQYLYGKIQTAPNLFFRMLDYVADEIDFNEIAEEVFSSVVYREMRQLMN